MYLRYNAHNFSRYLQDLIEKEEIVQQVISPLNEGLMRKRLQKDKNPWAKNTRSQHQGVIKTFRRLKGALDGRRKQRILGMNLSKLYLTKVLLQETSKNRVRESTAIQGHFIDIFEALKGIRVKEWNSRLATKGLKYY